MCSESTELCYLMQTVAWMGGDWCWRPDVIAEQLADFDDPRIHRDLDTAVRLGLLTRDADGCRLTDAGWALAAESDGV